MPTEKPRITFTLGENTLKAIEDYRFKNRIKNQSQAILSLIEIGMDATISEIKDKEKSPEAEASEDVIPREKSYRLFDALVASGLIVDDNLAAEDIQFLAHISDVVIDWFARKQRK